MSEETKQCPFCGEEIMSAAIKCRHCGEWLNRPETSEPSNNEPIQPKMIECPICGEEILATAKKCKHCGEMVSSEPSVRNERYAECNYELSYFKKIPTGMLLLLTIVTLGIYPLFWIYKTCEVLNTIEDNEKRKIEMWLPITYISLYILYFVVSVVFLSIPEIATVLNNMIFMFEMGFLITIVGKGLVIIENHAQKTCNVTIKHHSFWWWFCNFLYLNFAINSYKERVEKEQYYINRRGNTY